MVSSLHNHELFGKPSYGMVWWYAMVSMKQCNKSHLGIHVKVCTPSSSSMSSPMKSTRNHSNPHNSSHSTLQWIFSNNLHHVSWQMNFTFHINFSSVWKYGNFFAGSLCRLAWKSCELRVITGNCCLTPPTLSDPTPVSWLTDLAVSNGEMLEPAEASNEIEFMRCTYLSFLSVFHWFG